MSRILSIVVVATTVVVAAAHAPAAGAAADGGAIPVAADPSTSPYRPPVDRPVSDPFRAPAGPYGPGNRGLEYATLPGDAARAIGPGVVVFAGQVAGRGVVSVVHPDGLRSALTGLVAVRAAVGEVVTAGTVVGLAGPRLHLGVRRGDRYLDPALLFGHDRPRHAVLVPGPGPGRRLGEGGPAWLHSPPARSPGRT